MASHSDVATAFRHNKSLKGCNVYTDGTTIWSYGSHFPIAHRIAFGMYLFNTDKYSTSTSKHQTIVWRAIKDCNVTECSTEDIQKAMRNPNEPIVVMRDKNVDSIRDALDILKRVCKEKGLKRFPYEHLYNKLQGKLVLEAI